MYEYVFDGCFFSYNDPATPEVYTLSLHDALPILGCRRIWSRPNPLWTGHVRFARRCSLVFDAPRFGKLLALPRCQDRKSTRLNSSHRTISYAVFCLKKKNHTHDPLHLAHVNLTLL